MNHNDKSVCLKVPVGLLIMSAALAGDARPASRPILGAQIMDDPAATSEKVDGWMKILADHRMPLARVFVPRGEDALRRMDWFFRSAEKHGVGITATLGGEPSPETERWIHEVVARYKDSPALDSWILINEPGNAPKVDPLATGRFRVWLKRKYGTIERLNEAWRSRNSSFDSIQYDPQVAMSSTWSTPDCFLDWYAFWRDHLTWQLNWIADQIRKTDTVHPTHVNPHALIANLAANSQDMPAWRPFLSSLGASIHPSWHFSLLRRDQYPLGVAYVSSLIHGASEPKPFWITELQGGNTTNSGGRPLYPFPRDIAQWLWTGIGSGADRIVFWLLNNRSFARESGEWSLLDLQNQPSERLAAAATVAKVIDQNQQLFRDARPLQSRVTILLSLETMALQEWFGRTYPVSSTEGGKPVRLEARDRNAHVLAALGIYQALAQIGIQASVKHMHDFDWETPRQAPHLAVLPNVAALSGADAKRLETFVRNGNTALILGLTGTWDAENRFWTLQSRHPLENLVGATLKELRTLDEDCHVELEDPPLRLPSSLWVGEILNHSAIPIGRQNGWITAVRKKSGKGEAIWIPSLVDLGSWTSDGLPMARFLERVAEPFISNQPFRLVEYQPNIIMRTLRSGDSYILVVTNGSAGHRKLSIRVPKELSSRILWGEGSSMNSQGETTLSPRGTVVTEWRQAQ